MSIYHIREINTTYIYSILSQKKTIYLLQIELDKNKLEL